MHHLLFQLFIMCVLGIIFIFTYLGIQAVCIPPWRLFESNQCYCKYFSKFLGGKIVWEHTLLHHLFSPSEPLHENTLDTVSCAVYLFFQNLWLIVPSAFGAIPLGFEH